MEVINTIGRRKRAVARLYLKEGSGKITVNKRDYKEYFPVPGLQYIVTQPLGELEATDKFDVNVRLTGGGTKGQAEALRLALARALVKLDEENNRKPLKVKGFLTRDARVVERKKPGQPKARKKFQFSKR